MIQFLMVLVWLVMLTGCSDFYWAASNNGIPADSTIHVVSEHHQDTLWNGNFALRGGFQAYLHLELALDSSLDSLRLSTSAGPVSELTATDSLLDLLWILPIDSDRVVSTALLLDYAAGDTAFAGVAARVRIEEWRLAWGRSSFVLAAGASQLDSLDVLTGDSLTGVSAGKASIHMDLFDSSSLGNTVLWSRSSGDPLRLQVSQTQRLYYRVSNTGTTLLAFSDSVWIHRRLIEAQ